MAKLSLRPWRRLFVLCALGSLFLRSPVDAQIALEDSHLFIDGRETLLYGGDFQYFRLRDPGFDEQATKALWLKAILNMREAGVNLAQVYVPWDYHEVEEGQWDFEGAKDLGALMALMAENGLYVILKVGPLIMAEWPQGPGSYGAIPLWWKRKHPEALAMTPKGKAFKFFSPFYTGENQQQPSYLHPNFLSYVKTFYGRVAQEVKPYIGSTIIGVQIDNETNQYWSDIFSVDFSPSSILHYHMYLKHAYQHNIALLNQSYGTHFTDFSQVAPPKAWPQGPKSRSANSHIWDWYKCQENTVLVYLKTLKNMLHEVGFPRHNFLYTVNELPYSPSFSDMRLKHTLMPIPEKSKVALPTLDLYPKIFSFHKEYPFDYPYLPEFYLKLHKNHLKGQGLQPFLFASELQAGMWGHGVLGQPEVTKSSTIQILMKTWGNGLKGQSLYVFHDGLNANGSHYHYQAPLNASADPSDRYDVVRLWGHYLRDKGHLLTHTTPVNNRVALLVNRLYSVPQAGYLDDFSRLNSHEGPALLGWFTNAGFQIDVVDSQDATHESLKHFSHVIYQNPDLVDVHTEALLEGVRSRGGVVVNFLWPGKSLEALKDAPQHPFLFNWTNPTRSFLPPFHHTASGVHFWWNVGRRNLVQARFPWKGSLLDMPLTSYWYATTVSGRTLDPSWDIKPFLYYGNETVGFWKRTQQRDQPYIGTNVYYPFNSSSYYSLTTTQWLGLSSLAKYLLNGEDPIFEDTQVRQVVWARKGTHKGNPYAFIFLINDHKENRTLRVKPSRGAPLGFSPGDCVRLETQMRPGEAVWEGPLTKWEEEGAPWVVEPYGSRLILAHAISCPMQSDL